MFIFWCPYFLFPIFLSLLEPMAKKFPRKPQKVESTNYTYEAKILLEFFINIQIFNFIITKWSLFLQCLIQWLWLKRNSAGGKFLIVPK